MRCLVTALAIIGAAGAVLSAPVAAAAPECTKTGPNTTQCSTNGSSQIVTTPPAQNFGPWYPYGGFGLNLGGLAIVF